MLAFRQNSEGTWELMTERTVLTPLPTIALRELD